MRGLWFMALDELELPSEKARLGISVSSTERPEVGVISWPLAPEPVGDVKDTVLLLKA